MWINDKGGRDYITTEAQRRYNKKQYEANREAQKERVRKYSRENPEKIAEKNKRYSMTHDRSDYFRRRWEARKNTIKIDEGNMNDATGACEKVENGFQTSHNPYDVYKQKTAKAK